MILNQIVLEFLGRELVAILMYVFWLMLGLVLFNSWKDFIEFMIRLGRAIWFGIRWFGLKVWFVLRMIWAGIVWVALWIKKIALAIYAFLKKAALLTWKGIKWLALKFWSVFRFVWYAIVWVALGIKKIALAIWKVIKIAIDWVVKAAKFVWHWIVRISKTIIQLSWWILAGIGIAIAETFQIFVLTLWAGLQGVLHGLVFVFKWVFLPVYKLYKWIIIDQPLKAITLDIFPLWIHTQRWFKLQWQTLIFKVTGQSKKKPVVKVAKKVEAAPKKLAAEDKVVIKSVADVNQEQVNKLKAVVAKEEAMDDVAASKEAKAFETRRIFFKPFKAKADFFTRLNPGSQAEFTKLFMGDANNRLIPEIQFISGQENQAFFDKVFNFIYRLRKSISANLLTAMVEEGIRLADQDAEAKTNIYEAGIRVAYARRSNPNFLKLAESLAKQDVALHMNVLKTKNQFVYSVKRLAIILEKREAYDEAITLVNQALSVGLLDQTVGEYPERLVRLQAQKLVLEAKKTGKFVEKVEAPVVTTGETGSDEEDETKTIDLSKMAMKKTSFYESLTPELKAEFDRYFVLEGTDHLVKSLIFVPGKDNGTFFQNVFNQLYAYRKLISFNLLTALYEELLSQLEGQPALITAINEATIRIMFYRRKEAIFLDQCETLCQEDIALHLDVLRTRSGFVYSFKRLAILLEKQGLYEDAIAMCDRAINLNLDDKTQGGYRGRKERIMKRQLQQAKVGE